MIRRSLLSFDAGLWGQKGQTFSIIHIFAPTTDKLAYGGNRPLDQPKSILNLFKI
jgi:hypothetical protein